MKPSRLTAFMRKNGTLETYSAKEIYHSQDFVETLFMLKSGYVKRYQVTNDKKRVIELIYGPGHIFPLSQLYKKLFSVDMNQGNLIYVYQAMTDIEIWRVNDGIVLSALEKDPMLYQDLFYEAGLRLKSNIDRLASNALEDDYQKVAHQLVCLVDEFADEEGQENLNAGTIAVPLESIDMAEQLNISLGVADAVLGSLSKSGLIVTDDNKISIPDINLLKDTYL